MHSSLRSEYYDNELEVCPYADLLKPRLATNISPVSSQLYLAEGKLRCLFIQQNEKL